MPFTKKRLQLLYLFFGKYRLNWDKLIEAIDFLLAHLPANGKAVFDARFKALTAGYINWT